MNHKTRTEIISMLISCACLLGGLFSAYASVPDSHVNSTNQTTIESTEDYSSNKNDASKDKVATEERHYYLDEVKVTLETKKKKDAELAKKKKEAEIAKKKKEAELAKKKKEEELAKKKKAAEIAKKNHIEKLKTESPDMWVKPTNGSHNKPYEAYYAITDPTSKAYQFQCKSSVKVDSRGFLMENNTWYCVALGSYFGHVGDKFLFTLSSGKVIPVVIADMKADRDTDSQNYLSYGGHIIEFLINPHSWYMVSNGVTRRGSLNILPELRGKVTRIQRVTNEA